MTNSESKDDTGTGIHIGNVGRDLKVRGDIVAGNKVVIQKIIRQAAEKIITAPYKFLSSYDCKWSRKNPFSHLLLICWRERFVKSIQR